MYGGGTSQQLSRVRCLQHREPQDIALAQESTCCLPSFPLLAGYAPLTALLLAPPIWFTTVILQFSSHPSVTEGTFRLYAGEYYELFSVFPHLLIILAQIGKLKQREHCL